MRVKYKNLILGLILGLSLAFFVPQSAEAASWCSSAYGYSVAGIENVYQDGEISSLNFSVHDVIDGGSYQLVLRPGTGRSKKTIGSPVRASGTSVSFSTSHVEAVTSAKGNYKTLFLEWTDGGGNYECKLAKYEVKGGSGSCSISASQAGFTNPACFDHESSITIKVTNAKWDGATFDGSALLQFGSANDPTISINNGSGEHTINNPSSLGNKSSLNIKVYKTFSLTTTPMCVNAIGKVQDVCTDEQREEEPAEDKPFEICNQVPEAEAKGKCLECFGKGGVWTAIGCIDTSSTEGIVGKLMTVGISIAGGIALLMILAAAFLFATSEGEPKRTSEAKEILTSAIIGLIFIIFSVTILQFIGVNILRIPGFGE